MCRAVGDDPVATAPGTDKIYQPAHRAPLLNQEAELLQNYHPALRAPLLSRRGARREPPRQPRRLPPSVVRRGVRRREPRFRLRWGCFSYRREISEKNGRRFSILF